MNTGVTGACLFCAAKSTMMWVRVELSPRAKGVITGVCSACYPAWKAAMPCMLSELENVENERRGIGHGYTRCCVCRKSGDPRSLALVREYRRVTDGKMIVGRDTVRDHVFCGAHEPLLKAQLSFVQQVVEHMRQEAV